MIDQLADTLLRYTERQPGEGPYLTAIEGVGILRCDHPKPPLHLVSRPSICIVAQGAKRASFGDTQLEYRAGQALVVGIETPSVGRVFEASRGEPCLVLAMELDLAILRRVAQTLRTPPAFGAKAGRAAFVTRVEGPLAECAVRMVRLLDMPEAIATIHPLLVQEMCYWLLTGPQGGDVFRLALSAPSQKLIDALHTLQLNYRKPMRVEDLAGAAQMSPSVFHRQFKALTSLSPLQYLKQMRLLEARRMLTSSSIKVETVAFEVGYGSPSQFSREYTRLFGTPPKRDVQRMLAAAAVI